MATISQVKVRGNNRDIMDKTARKGIAEYASGIIGAGLNWAQGGYGAIANYSSPEANTSSTRVRTEYVFGDPVSIEIHNDDANYLYSYAAFDEQNNVISSSAAFTTGITQSIPGCKTIRIAIRNSDNSGIMPGAYDFGVRIVTPKNVKNIGGVLDFSLDSNLAYTQGEFEQGSYEAISNYANPQKTTNRKRIRNEILFASPADVEIHMNSTDYQYIYCAFNDHGSIIRSNGSYSSDIVHIPQVSVLRLVIKKNDSDASYFYIDEIKNTGLIIRKTKWDSLSYDDHGVMQNVNPGMYDYTESFGNYIFDPITSADAQRNFSSIRLSADITFADERYMVIPKLNANFEYVYYAFDSNGNSVAGSQSWINKEIFAVNVKRLHITIRKVNSPVLTVKDVYESGFCIPESGYYKPERPDATQTPVKAMAYNIGKFGYGVSSGIPESVYSEKLMNYKKFFCDESCDVCGIAEFGVYIDEDQTIKSNDVLFDHLYKYADDTPNSASIKANTELFSIRRLTLSTGRNFTVCEVHIGDKSVVLANTHLTPNAGTEEDAKRATERAEIIDYLKNVPYFILFGDFNAQSTSDYDDFVDAGFTLANGPYLGFEFTYSYSPSDFDTDTPSDNIRYFDNIIVPAKIKVMNSRAVNVYRNLTSDHIPFVADLVITE